MPARLQVRYNDRISKELTTTSPPENLDLQGRENIDFSQLRAGELAVPVDMVFGHLRSRNFESGNTGWEIEYGGDSEFNNITARGFIESQSGNIGSWTINNDSLSSGDVVLHSNEYLGIVADNYNETGVWLGMDNNLPKVSFVKDTNNYLRFDGNILEIGGKINVTSSDNLKAMAYEDVVETDKLGNTIVSGNFIKTGLIDVQDIFTNTLTLTSGGNIQSNTYTAGSAGFIIQDTGFAEFNNVIVRGEVQASSGSFNGSITSTSGTIGGWSIGSDRLVNNDLYLLDSGRILAGPSNQRVSLDSTDPTYRLWVGDNDGAQANFSVDTTGSVYANNGTFIGTITSTSGNIGGWSIQSDRLVNNDLYLINDGRIIAGPNDQRVQIDATNTSYRFWIGNNNPNVANFRVTPDGSITANNGTFNGTITASAGDISGDLNMSGGITLSQSDAYIRSGPIGNARFLLIRDSNDEPKLQFDDDNVARMQLLKDKLEFYNADGSLSSSLSGGPSGFPGLNVGGSVFCGGISSFNPNGNSLGGAFRGMTSNGYIVVHEGDGDSFAGTGTMSMIEKTNPATFNTDVFFEVRSYSNWLILSQSKSTDGAIMFEFDGVLKGYFDWVGDWYIDGDYLKTSDKRLKKNISDISLSYSYNLLNNLTPKYFEKKDTNSPSYGFLAQDVLEYDDDNVFVSENEYMSLDYMAFIPILFNVVQDLEKRIKNIEDMIQ